MTTQKEIPMTGTGWVKMIDTQAILSQLRAMSAEAQKVINDQVSEQCAWSDPVTYYETLWTLMQEVRS